VILDDRAALKYPMSVEIKEQTEQKILLPYFPTLALRHSRMRPQQTLRCKRQIQNYNDTNSNNEKHCQQGHLESYSTLPVEDADTTCFSEV